MDKSLLINLIIATLGENMAALENAARASHAEATHESSRADNKYDTRGLEAAYLAGGQARQAKEILDSIKIYQKILPRRFTADDPIDLTALVELEIAGVKSLYFIGPKSGGLEIQHNRQEITVITPQSPLGQNLAGKTVGAQWSIPQGRTTVKYKIISVE
jgi:transcription elongation GreA/GreB family factor